jgi:hypothetical protein
MIPKFKSFEASVLYFNGMYRLPISAVPGFEAEQTWQNAFYSPAMGMSPREAFAARAQAFFGKILQKELNEHVDLLENASIGSTDDVDVLVELADLLGDIQVYCASEMARFGLPNEEILKIIMASNFSKLGVDGNPIYDEDGKVSKGPGYWKPEPKIKELLIQLRGDPA